MEPNLIILAGGVSSRMKRGSSEGLDPHLARVADTGAKGMLGVGSLGCVGEGLFKGIAGINAIESGFKKVIIKTFIPDGLTFAKASLKTVYGHLKSEWKRNENNLMLDITIPFNTQAILVLPSYEYEINSISKLIKKQNGFTNLEVGSGSYEIRCKLP